ncbi:NUMOD4 domain-containing protein [Mycobacterium gordonae]|uniref:NUMOD4 domain-containing protein n=1 Tax=Mycobacterium gordonae TaxID=1778 RepID=UPI0009F3B715|nr:NUMOD4 domain-containing protein [Mycobacterium gordonae]MCV7009495.1 HNH endonuclease [Mycobacterium gordonae]
MSKHAFHVDISGREHLEEWRPIPGLGGKYEASNLGRVRSRRCILKQRLNYRGYAVVELCYPDKPGSQESLVHRQVLKAFGGEPAEGQECRHLNGNQTDNRAENLAWGSRSENSIDQVVHGTHRNVRKTHCKRGHLFDEENTRLRPNGTRLCRACKREYDMQRFHAASKLVS